MLCSAYPLTWLRSCQEFLSRPTAPAHWWEEPNGHVLGGRDLLRKEQGTWLGMTKQGRIAVLTNFREEGAITIEARSRGEMVNAFLTQSPSNPQSTKSFVESLLEGDGLKGIGGFTLVCGKIGELLAVISNRTPNAEDITWIAKDEGETIGLSNAAFANRSWPKVLRGEELLETAIKENIENMAPRSSLVENLFEVLSDDTLPKRSQGMGLDSYLKELRNSIFIPPIAGEGAGNPSAEDLAAAASNLKVEEQTEKAKQGDGQGGVYGTQKQTVIIVDHSGCVIFVERTLYDENGTSTARSSIRDRERRYDFFLEGWDEDKR